MNNYFSSPRNYCKNLLDIDSVIALTYLILEPTQLLMKRTRDLTCDSTKMTCDLTCGLPLKTRDLTCDLTIKTWDLTRNLARKTRDLKKVTCRHVWRVRVSCLLDVHVCMCIQCPSHRVCTFNWCTCTCVWVGKNVSVCTFTWCTCTCMYEFLSVYGHVHLLDVHVRVCMGFWAYMNMYIWLMYMYVHVWFVECIWAYTFTWCTSVCMYKFLSVHEQVKE